jgi:hypothetical protein
MEIPRVDVDIKSSYQHGRLSSQDSIRLIKIVPGLVFDQHICCIISEHALAQACDVPRVKYRALSYLWGDPEPSRRIYVRDATSSRWRSHEIHSNLWRFLVHMWRKEQFEILVWTDRLCLNQDDDEEIAQQIPRMGLIYRQAEKVVIWLGLSAWEEKHLQHHKQWSIDENRWEEIDSKSERPPLDRLAIYSVQDHEYWKRMWVAQEVAMGKEVVVEMQDTPSIDLEDMYKSATGFRSANNEGMAWYMMQLIRLRGSTGKTPLEPKPSWRLLRDHCQRRSTRQQDHIYGLLGMVEQNDPILQIAIDYNQPASDVLFDALFTATNPSLGEENLAVAEALASIGLLDDINSLEGYSNRDHNWRLTANEVVRKFARISLVVFDALNFIVAALDNIELWTGDVQKIVKQISRLEPPGINDFQWKAVIGVILAVGLRDDGRERLVQWMKARWPKFEEQSECLWVCSKHASQPLSPDLEQLMHVKQKVWLDSRTFRPSDAVSTCRYHRQYDSLCEGFHMILEVLDSGTRLEFDFTNHRENEAVLNIWFKRGPTEVSRG